jgi:hypothetical protein
MSTKRSIAIAGLIAAALTLTACSTGGTPTPTKTTSTPSPTSTALNSPVAAPKSQDDAIAAAETVLATWYKTRGAVNAAGGKDTDPLKLLSTGPALQITLDDAGRIATGPLLNADGQSIPGAAKTTGALTFEPGAAYGQKWQNVENGLVTVDGCQDASNYHITTHDGKPAMRPPHDRIKLEYQVTYDPKSQLWLVSKQVDLQATC